VRWEQQQNPVPVNFIKALCQENKKVNCINFSDIRNVTDKLLSTDPEIL